MGSWLSTNRKEIQVSTRTHFMARSFTNLNSHQDDEGYESSGCETDVDANSLELTERGQRNGVPTHASTRPSTSNPGQLQPSSLSVMRRRNRPWIASDTDYRFALNIINDSHDPVNKFFDEVDAFSAKHGEAYRFVKKKNPRPKDLHQRVLAKTMKVGQRTVFAMAEMRGQLLKVVEAFLTVIQTTDTPTPNLLSKFYEMNNVVSLLSPLPPDTSINFVESARHTDYDMRTNKRNCFDSHFREERTSLVSLVPYRRTQAWPYRRATSPGILSLCTRGPAPYVGSGGAV